MNNFVKVEPVKGRPMLGWAGKMAPREVQDFPAQLVESFRVSTAPKTPTWENLQQQWCNLLFHGDNIEILSTLLVNGFRGQVDLIYIDPPFDSGADYVRKVRLRGHKGKALRGENISLIEEKQYEDIWANDTYLQYMYERLVLMRELLSEKGSIYLHCDYHKSHHLRFLMDEVFGQDNFINEIIWAYHGPGSPNMKQFNRKHDSIFWYSRSKEWIFNKEKARVPYHESTAGKFESKGTGFAGTEAQLGEGKIAEDWWIMPISARIRTEISDYPTQKPSKLLKRIIEVSTNENSLVFDAFCGSGTTAAVAERLGRRWIACDMNKGAIQTTVKRLLKQEEEPPSPSFPSPPLSSRPRPRGFVQYRVNNYDFQEQDRLKDLIAQKYGLEKVPSDLYFNGIADGDLVKIAPLNRPMSAKDIEEIEIELKARPKEDRNIRLLGYGSERSIHNKVAERNRQAAINKIKVYDIQRDSFYASSPPRAEIEFNTQDENLVVTITIKDFFSPTVMQRLNGDRTIFDEDIDDFRATIDCIYIDNNYNGKDFSIIGKDIPAKKNDLVKGTYTVKLAHSKAVIAVKIIDMLGEETLTLYPYQTPKS